MKTNVKRREFLVESCKAGMACCALLMGSRMIVSGKDTGKPDAGIPDPKKLNYCGYTCPPDCKMKRAGQENDLALKREAYTDWRIEKKYGIAFDPDQVFCHGCKSDSEHPGIVVERCTVRTCAMEKGYDCCIQCGKVAGCDKEIWTTFPDFHRQVIGMRQKYLAASR